MPGVTLKSVSKAFGKVTAVDHISLTVDEGEMITLLGPSGCGKTTTLRLIAGLEILDSGEICLGDRVLASDERKFCTPPDKRQMGMVFQSYAVWPHMSVFENVAYPLKLRKVPREQIRERVRGTLALVGLESLADRPSTNLSGGQQQRVALARALVFTPSVLLLDEPLSNLDAKLREQMRVELKDLQRRVGVTAIYVTHDQTEAMALSDRIVIMNRGKIEQIGSPRDIYERPKTRFATDFLGTVDYVTVEVVQSDDNECVLRANGNGLILRGPGQDNLSPGQKASLAVRAHNVKLHCCDPGKEHNVWKCTVLRCSYLGDRMDYQVRIGDESLRVYGDPSLSLTPGDTVFVELDWNSCWIFPKE